MIKRMADSGQLQRSKVSAIDLPIRQYETSYFASILALAFMALWLLFGATGCSKGSCDTDNDCKSGKICQGGKCVSPEIDTDLGTDTYFPYIPTDTTRSTLPSTGNNGSDSSDGTDSSTNTDIEIGTDTSSSIDDQCEPSKQYGEQCAQNCECYDPGQCNNGICCPGGECCSVAADCVHDLCLSPRCDGNNDCQYSVGGMHCGVQDTQGTETCTGDSACDGNGNCVPIASTNCGFFAVADYTCTAGPPTEVCYTTCTTTNVETNCIPGSACEDGVCVGAQTLENGSPCEQNGQCRSVYCANGFCCPEGECCSQASDCSESICRQRSCGPDFRCHYSLTGFACGKEDTEDGDTCTGNSRCDGAGNCSALALCDGAYSWDDSFVCEDDQVHEGCFDSCFNAGQCTDNYYCNSESSQCEFFGLFDGEPCINNSECNSGHCSNGYCCITGMCCQTHSDCDDSLCNESASCGEDFVCHPAEVTPCGSPDSDGDQTCSGDSLCDGAGNCVLITQCNGAYIAVEGSYTCNDDGVSEHCWDECHNPFNDYRCSEGYTCENEQCVPIGLLPDGGSCTTGSECESGHCSGGLCCASGDCCNTEADCQISPCMRSYCGGDRVCDYRPIAPCGTADNIDEAGDGSAVCNGDSLCDGQGNCSVVQPCTDSAYAPTGTYLCAGGGVAEACYTSCDSNDECNDGYYCLDGSCSEKIPNGGSGCTQNGHCVSHYCNTTNGICCDEGFCCDSSDDCGTYQCDLTNFACVYSCQDDNDVDSDAICSPLGDFHCDHGICHEDLPNGEGPCNENTDCLSEHCDGNSNICCASGSCCEDDEDCSGGLCDQGQCAESCGEDDALCGEEYHCDSDICVPDIPNGEGTCDEDSDCESNNCTETTGICCSEGDGDCCNNVTHCDDGNACTLDGCSVFYHCYHLDKAAGESCDDGVKCNGTERCDADGTCLAGTPPCEGLDTPCRTYTCNETTGQCDDEPIASMVGQDCTEPLDCLDGRAKQCTSTGSCEDPNPAAGGPCDDLVPPNACTQYICIEGGGADPCVEVAMSDGDLCDDGDPCTGDQNRCYGGICVHSDPLPCDDGNPCTEDICTPNGDEPECTEPHAPIEDFEPCNDHFNCFGNNPVCIAGTCVPNEPICADDRGICTIHECSESYYGGIDCGRSTENPGVPAECGGLTTVDTVYFATREYFSYNSSCTGDDFSGKEAFIAVNIGENEGSVTVSVESVSPTMDIAFMDMGNYCDPNTCVSYALNTITISGTGYYPLVLEAMDDLPPDSLEIRVTACPQ